MKAGKRILAGGLCALLCCALLPALSEPLTYRGAPLALDQASQVWYLPSEEWLAALDLEKRTPGTEGASVPGAFDVYRASGAGSETERVLLTGLPVLRIDTESGALPGDAEEPASLTYCETAANGSVRVIRSSLQIRLRGNTSRRYPKNSYRLKLTDDTGDKRKLSLAGLREDDDWILNPMYSDTSKIREALSYSLWNEMNSSGRAAAGSRGAFLEVILNGDYRGLYSLQERIDRKQVDADKGTGILYKVDTNHRPTAEELAACEDPEACGGLQLSFSGSRVTKPWQPAAEYIAFLEGDTEDCRLSRENAVDFCLWSVLTQARDCHYKNQYIHCVLGADGYTLYRIPWDLNHTLGDLWSGSSEETNYLSYEATFPALDDVSARWLQEGDAGFRDALRSRWTALRESVITEERLLDQAESLFQALYPAIERDTARWPQSGMGEGNAANIRDLRDFLQANLLRMDRWIQELQNESGE